MTPLHIQVVLRLSKQDRANQTEEMMTMIYPTFTRQFDFEVFIMQKHFYVI